MFGRLVCLYPAIAHNIAVRLGEQFEIGLCADECREGSPEPAYAIDIGAKQFAPISRPKDESLHTEHQLSTLKRTASEIIPFVLLRPFEQIIGPLVKSEVAILLLPVDEGRRQRGRHQHLMKIHGDAVCPLNSPEFGAVIGGKNQGGAMRTIDMKPQSVFFAKICQCCQVIKSPDGCRAGTTDHSNHLNTLLNSLLVVGLQQVGTNAKSLIRRHFDDSLSTPAHDTGSSVNTIMRLFTHHQRQPLPAALLPYIALYAARPRCKQRRQIGESSPGSQKATTPLSQAHGLSHCLQQTMLGRRARHAHLVYGHPIVEKIPEQACQRRHGRRWTHLMPHVVRVVQLDALRQHLPEQFHRLPPFFQPHTPAVQRRCRRLVRNSLDLCR